MPPRRLRLATAVAAAALALLAAAPATDGAVDAFRALRAEAAAAAGRKDFAGAERLLARADALIPNYPPVLLAGAQMKAARGDTAGALVLLERHAAAGLAFDPGALRTAPPFAAVVADPRFAIIEQRWMANARPVGGVAPEFVLDWTPFLAESVAWDAGPRRWLVSSVHQGTVVQVLPGAGMRPFLGDAAGGRGVFGLVLDPRRRVLWAAASPAPQHVNGAAAASLPELLEADLRTGRVLRRFPAPPPGEGGRRSFGDVALGPDGSVYVSDSTAGEIFRLRPRGRTLEPVTRALSSPQGIAATPDGRALIVADYPGGLHRVDLATGAASRLSAPPDALTVWIDGLLRDGDSLIAVQNATTPQRVLRFEMSPDWRRVTGWRVLAASPLLSEPTGGVIIGDDLVFVARSQWTEFTDDGALRGPKPAPAAVARLPLRSRSTGEGRQAAARSPLTPPSPGTVGRSQ